MIVQALSDLQHHKGWLPQPELRALSQQLSVPLYRIQEVASFFPHFRFDPPPAVEVQVCRDMSCRLRGSGAILDSLQQEFPADANSAANRPGVCISGVSCLGRCDRAPAARVNGVSFHARSADELAALTRQAAEGKPLPEGDSDEAWELPQAHSTWQLDPYRGQPTYSVVRQFLAASDQNAERKRLIKALETAGLLGMGGAGGRAYKKWQDVLEAEGTEKYVVCNGDESEPGTFKDREILLRMPHLVLEGMILGGLVVGAQAGYVYIRHEYEEQIEAVRQAIQAARRMGVCGPDLLGTGIGFELEVFVSPGGYICGEQSALIEAMEDKRAEPRNRPPQLQTNGLRDKPTLLNNVETLAWVPAIALNEEGAWFARQGRPKCKGLRLFSISGDIARPGVYEVPNGLTLRELIHDFAGGMRDGLPLKAWAPSGPSGGFLPARLPRAALGRRYAEGRIAPEAEFFDLLDFELDIQLARDAGIMLGAGMVVYAEGANLVEQARACSEFFRNELCGKCVPCRLGSTRFAEFAGKLHAGQVDAAQLQQAQPLFVELGTTMEITSICGLGTVSPNPVNTLLKYFPADVAAACR